MDWIVRDSAVKVHSVQVELQNNDLMKDETGNFVPFLLSGSLDPYPTPTSARYFPSHPALQRPSLPQNCRAASDPSLPSSSLLRDRIECLD